MTRKPRILKGPVKGTIHQLRFCALQIFYSQLTDPLMVNNPLQLQAFGQSLISAGVEKTIIFKEEISLLISLHAYLDKVLSVLTFPKNFITVRVDILGDAFNYGLNTLQSHYISSFNI